jgi:predicted Holliday junction resolvase-like endonuclease
MFLEIILSDTVSTIIIVAISILIVAFSLVLYKKNEVSSTLTEKLHALEINNEKNKGVIVDKETQIEKIIAEMKVKAQENATVIFEEWKENELAKYIKVVDEMGRKKSDALLSQWILENESRIRKDAANRSVRNVLGKVTEHLIPFSEAMKQFNPKEIRFIGSPIDLIVFDGIEEPKEGGVVIHFIEVKTGTAALSKRQLLIKDAIEKGRVEWKIVDKRNFGDEVNAELSK